MNFGKLIKSVKVKERLVREIKPVHDLSVRDAVFTDVISWKGLTKGDFGYFWGLMPKDESLKGKSFEEVVLKEWNVPQKLLNAPMVEANLLKLAKLRDFQRQVNQKYPTWVIVSSQVKVLKFVREDDETFTASLTVCGVCND